MISNLLVLVQIAFRNLFSSALNLIIGAIILVGTMLVVIGSSMVDSLDQSMSRSITGSVSGHIQIYSSESKDEVAIYGGMGGEADLAPLDNFTRIKDELSKVENVQTVVPMGINAAMLTSGNTVDLTLAKLREAVNARDEARKTGADARALDTQIDNQKQLVRQMVKVLQSDAAKGKELMDAKAVDPENAEALARVATDEFWNGFNQDPYGSLEFLENRIAPQVTDADLLYVRYVGTDLDTFQTSFDRMQIVDGTRVPEGQRGFLFSKFFYEEFLKLKPARRLDLLKEGLGEAGKTLKDPVLAELVRQNRSQTREIVLQLDGLETKQAVQKLQQGLASKETDVSALLSDLFDVDEQNFQARYDLFYKEIAPLLELYRVRVGDILTIKAFTRSGYVQSVNVKVYGTFNFNGLEKSPLAGGSNLMDLMSFRDLYGFLSADREKEVKELQAASGAKSVDRANAEDELFGSGRTVVAEATPGIIDDAKELSGTAKALRNEDLVRRVYSKDEIESGVVLNSAIILKDPRRLDETLARINALSNEKGLKIKAVSWQQASGILGQMVRVMKGVLYFAVFIIFVVAMIIINNAMMMATLQRTQTIGTMRAIGAQNSFILSMVMVETLVLGLSFGAVGTLLGAGVMTLLKSNGIGATTDIMYFFFSGPRLYPTMGVGNLIAAFVIILVVSSISTLIPAVLATRVSPLRAMQSDE